MKIYLGFILLMFSFQCPAKSKTTVMFLRAVVPETYKIEIKLDKNGVHPSYKTNALKGHARPVFHISKLPGKYIVSIVHP